MSIITAAAQAALNCVVVIASAVPLVANAAEPVNPPPPSHKPYQPVVQDDVTGAYQYRTRILVSPPSCQNFAKQADAAFLSSTFDEKTKAEELKRIGAAAAAAGCLAP